MYEREDLEVWMGGKKEVLKRCLDIYYVSTGASIEYDDRVSWSVKKLFLQPEREISILVSPPHYLKYIFPWLADVDFVLSNNL